MPEEMRGPVEQALHDYEAVRTLGARESICERAGLVVQAMVEEEPEFYENEIDEWRAIAHNDCEAAKLPTF